MKKLLFIAFAIVTSLQLQAQILTPVKWAYGSKKTGKQEAVIFIKATIDEGWHVYSQNVKPGGPSKTKISFENSKAYKPVGKTQEPASITRYEKGFGMNVSFFEKSVIFQQKIKLTSGQATVKGTLEYMVCNDKQCLPPETITFNIPVK